MTKSEELFEAFLKENAVSFVRIPEANEPTPDYLLDFNGYKIIVEIKEISEDVNFKTGQFAVSSRTVGKHVRDRISKAKTQIQQANKKSLPAVLLIYNRLDTDFQLFGTEDHDFRDAILGEYTVVLQNEPLKIIDSYHGLNKSFLKSKNTSFSAVGRLKLCGRILEVTLFGNPYAKIRLDCGRLPACFKVDTPCPP